MPGVNPKINALAEVTDGWTGEARIAVGGLTASVTPADRESAFSVMRRLLVEAIRVHGVGFGVWSTTGGKFEIVGNAVITITVTGTTMGRLGMTGALSGSTGYTFPTAYAGGVIASDGIGVHTPVIKTKKGRAMATGGAAFRGAFSGGKGRLRAYDGLGDVVTLVGTLEAGGTYDAAIFRLDDMPILTRFRVRAVARTRWGMLGSNARVRASLVEVSG